jgi:hypothetical protein
VAQKLRRGRCRGAEGEHRARAASGEQRSRLARARTRARVADRRNWTIPAFAEIEAREGVRMSRSQLSKALRKKIGHQTFTDTAALDQAIHDAFADLNRERIPQSVGQAANLGLGFSAA